MDARWTYARGTRRIRPHAHERHRCSLAARAQLRGVAYYRLGEHELAMTHWRSGLKFDPEHAGCKDMYRLLKKLTKKADAADAALADGRVADAIAGWRDAIAVDPGHYAFMGPLLVKVRCAHPSECAARSVTQSRPLRRSRAHISKARHGLRRLMPRRRL